MYRRDRENPSFSSSLLDEIYRSIDQPGDEKEKSFYAKSERCFLNEYEREKVMVRRRSLADVKRSVNNFSSSSSSGGSSCGGGFSSSETESVYGLSRPKPIRTATKHSNSYSHRYELEDLQPNKHESKFVKTKSRAMKIYGDLKKAKQPISPGGRLASFLNSIFTSNNAKNTKSVPRTYDHHKSKSVNASTCSSASSFSRSCLSNTPSSRGKLTNNNKSRSVRFVIVEDDSHKSEKTARHSSEKTRKIEEAARNLLKNYQKKVECFENYVANNVKDHNEIEMSYDDDDDDDDASNASSDLFELENFAVIGNEKYGDELPVYGTTRIDMNIM